MLPCSQIDWDDAACDGAIPCSKIDFVDDCIPCSAVDFTTDCIPCDAIDFATNPCGATITDPDSGDDVFLNGIFENIAGWTVVPLRVRVQGPPPGIQTVYVVGRAL